MFHFRDDLDHAERSYLDESVLTDHLHYCIVKPRILQIPADHLSKYIARRIPLIDDTEIASELAICPQFSAATWQEHWSGRTCVTILACDFPSLLSALLMHAVLAVVIQLLLHVLYHHVITELSALIAVCACDCLAS
jgi:hypothetical protein